MQQLEKAIYIDNSYPGVTLGALILNFGHVLIDAPPHPDDSRSWRIALRGLGSSVGRMLVNMDSHLDRTLGARGMECQVIAHTKTAEIIGKRPAIFKGLHTDTGSDWELCDGIAGIRWAKPNLTFSDRVLLEWDEENPVNLEHHPGPEPGAIWTILPTSRVVFIGDAVTVDQPPFFHRADITPWLDALALLSTARFRNYTIVSSRGGIVDIQYIRQQRQLLKDIQKKLEKMHSQGAPAETTIELIDSLLDRLEFPPERKAHYTNRLRNGLFEYYLRHYYPKKEIRIDENEVSQ